MRKTFSFILNLAIYAGIVLAVVWGVPYLLEKKLGSEHPIAVVTSSSMWPVLKAGDVVFIEQVTREMLKEHDIVVWASEGGGFTIHRVVRLDEATLTTKGDANFKEDEPVSYAAVVGRAAVRGGGTPWRIPYLGFAAKVSQTVRVFSFASTIMYERSAL